MQAVRELICCILQDNIEDRETGLLNKQYVYVNWQQTKHHRWRRLMLAIATDLVKSAYGTDKSCKATVYLSNLI